VERFAQFPRYVQIESWLQKPDRKKSDPDTSVENYGPNISGDGGSETGLPDFSWCNIPNWGKIYQMITRLSNAHKIYPMVVNHSK
jgi:hypothetical protein